MIMDGMEPDGWGPRPGLG